MPLKTLTLPLESREPAYGGNGMYYWRCASRGVTLEEVLANVKHLLPWNIFHGMPGTKDGYTATYSSKEAAVAALAEGIRKPSRD